MNIILMYMYGVKKTMVKILNDVRPYLTKGLSYISAQKSLDSCLSLSSMVDKLIETLFSKDNCIVRVAYGHWYITYNKYILF